MATHYSGRQGNPYWRARAMVLAASSLCWLCGHLGARTIDHVISVKECRERGLWHLLDDPANMRPAHGTRNRCPVCGLCCNQSRARIERFRRATVKQSREW